MKKVLLLSTFLFLFVGCTTTKQVAVKGNPFQEYLGRDIDEVIAKFGPPVSVTNDDGGSVIWYQKADNYRGNILFSANERGIIYDVRTEELTQEKKKFNGVSLLWLIIPLVALSPLF